MSDHQAATTVSCAICAQRVTITKLKHQQKAMCPNCGHTITRFNRFHAEYTFTLSVAAIILLLLSIPYPFLSLVINGQDRVISLATAMQTLVQLEFFPLAIITALTTLVLPCFMLCCYAILAWCRYQNTQPPWLKKVFVLTLKVTPWAMADIFLVGMLISLVKIVDLATIEIGISLVTFILFVGCLSLAYSYFDKIHYAHWLGLAPEPDTMTANIPEQSNSVQHTWALLFTSLILYIPANTYPILITNLYGNSEPNTIIGGVITLWRAGSYPIAIIIFAASVMIPIGKLIVLAWLNWSIQTQSSKLRSSRTAVYSITEWIGRWSMIDVFVVAVLVALIQLGDTISVLRGIAVLAFCAVVCLTMLAALTFNTKLIWRSQMDKTR